MPAGNISKKHYNSTTGSENIAFERFGMVFFILLKPDVSGVCCHQISQSGNWLTGWPAPYYYKKWADTAQFDLLLEELRGKIRIKMGQKADPSLGIVDSQSVRWGNNRSLNGFDGNKKVKGVKRHVVVDKNGFLIAVMVSIANVHDGKAVLLLMQVLKEMLCGIKVILADGGYRGEIIAEIKKSFGYIIQVVLRSDKFEKEFKPIHKRWIIERTFAWFDNDRRLCRNYELLMETAEEMVKLAAIKHLLNKI
ncbi:transposase [Dyadobacter jejuensis]|uniref:Transposase n=1 Tax=Dyadobacter jejuensis TaxID=1082580 RepID=A0A316AQ30_9BACT|nr:IS5 family transposase [Dyadobacter jejuensis]PWJ59692.1 transposase [Dyadobacter jejuensis]